MYNGQGPLIWSHMSLVRKPFKVSNQVGPKHAYSNSEDSQRLEISVGRKKQIRGSACAIAQLIYAFVYHICQNFLMMWFILN